MISNKCYHPQSSISEYRERDGWNVIISCDIGVPYFEKGKRYTNRSFSRYRHRQVLVLCTRLIYRNELSDVDFERLYFKESFLQNPWKEDV